MKPKATFYHAGCSVCVSVEQALGQALDPARYDVEIVDFNTAPDRIAEAEAAGVQSVPAYVIDGQPFHINFVLAGLQVETHLRWLMARGAVEAGPGGDYSRCG